jgi:hypothetical protein
MASPPRPCARFCRSMKRLPPAPFERMSSPSQNAPSKPWGTSSGRLSTAVRRNGAACRSPIACSPGDRWGSARAQRKEGWFGVIAGMSLLVFKRGEESQKPVSSLWFASVQTYDQKSKRRPVRSARLVRPLTEQADHVSLRWRGHRAQFPILPAAGPATSVKRQQPVTGNWLLGIETLFGFLYQ